MRVHIQRKMFFVVLMFQTLTPTDGIPSEPIVVVSGVAPVFPAIAQATYASGDVV
jgi:hypothetical protein